MDPPIIQGGMGVRVSRAMLAAAVAKEGCAGTIASVGLAQYETHPDADFTTMNREALRQEIRTARQLTDGVLGVNVMVAVTDYESLIRICVEEQVDLIISGAGLPLQLPAYTEGTDIQLVPIVSSVRSLKIICRKWARNFNRIPDGVIIEGTKAGGHLGYRIEEIESDMPSLEKTLADVLQFTRSLSVQIPVIAAGGIFSGEDIAYFMKLGASGVQMGTRFVCTEECDVHENFKKAYLNAKSSDLALVKSPVGLPGKVIKNAFVEKLNEGQRLPFKCKFQCLKTCNPATAPYCIANVLAKAAEGKMDEAFAFAGSNAWRCNEIISVKQLINKIEQEYRHVSHDVTI
nr:nitronate monooxygenase [Anaerohalosphaera lusitana]